MKAQKEKGRANGTAYSLGCDREEECRIAYQVYLGGGEPDDAFLTRSNDKLNK